MLQLLPQHHALKGSIIPNLKVRDLMGYGYARREAMRIAKSNSLMRSVTMVCMRHDDTVQLIEFGRRGGVKKIHWDFGKASSLKEGVS